MLLYESVREMKSQILKKTFQYFFEFQLQDEVVPIMVSYACVGVFSAVVQLISVVLPSAYVAQITRKRQRRKQQQWVQENQFDFVVWLQGFTEDGNSILQILDPLL